MKKIITFIIIILLCGCSINKILKINNVTSIVYDKTELISNDYNTIIDKINSITFYKLNDDKIKGNKLEIRTREFLYNFEILDNFIIYTIDNERYFSKVNDIKNDITNIIEKYNDNQFYTVEKINDFDINKADYLINIDQSNNYIVINSKMNIYSFKINKIEKEKENYVDINLLNTVEKIEMDKNICIQTKDPQNIRISFITPYNYKVTIIYDENKKAFKKEMKPK